MYQSVPVLYTEALARGHSLGGLRRALQTEQKAMLEGVGGLKIKGQSLN